MYMIWLLIKIPWSLEHPHGPHSFLGDELDRTRTGEDSNEWLVFAGYMNM